MTYLEKVQRAVKVNQRNRKPHYWYSQRDGWQFAGYLPEGQPTGEWWRFCDHMDQVFGWGD